MTLVDNANQWWRWLSVQLAVVGGAIQGAAMAFPSLKDWLSDEVIHGAGVVMFLGIILGRLVKQNDPNA